MAIFLSSSLSVYNPKLPKPSNISKLGFINETHQNALSILYKPLKFSIKTQPSIQFLPKIPCSCSSGQKPSFFTTFSQKAAILIFGSLLFLGRFNLKHALAMADAPKANFSENLGEKKDTQKEKLEDEDLYVKILEKNPNDVKALKVVLYGMMKKGKMGEAVKLVERLIEVEPEDVEWRLLEALSFELMRDLGKAKTLFMEILKERPLLIKALHGLALAMHKNSEGPAVFEMLNKALELARREKRVTEERNIRILIAQMHVVTGDLEGALKLFQELAKEDHRDFRPYLCQGIVYSLLYKKKEADEQFEIYQNLIPEEYPQRGFINDVILAAKAESQEQLQKDFESEFSYKNNFSTSNDKAARTRAKRSMRLSSSVPRTERRSSPLWYQTMKKPNAQEKLLKLFWGNLMADAALDVNERMNLRRLVGLKIMQLKAELKRLYEMSSSGTQSGHTGPDLHPQV